MRDSFAQEIKHLAEQNKDIVLLSGLTNIKKLPQTDLLIVELLKLT